MAERFEGVYESLVDPKTHPMPPDEFREFIRHIKSEVISKCTRFSNFDWREDPSLVEDMAQQVCMEICSSIHRFERSLGTFKNWVDSIALNTVRGYIRNQIRKPSPVSLDNMVEQERNVSDDLLMSVSPELMVLKKEKRKLLGKLMVRLHKNNSNYYQALYYRSYCGMSAEDTAAEMNCDIDSVYRLTNRALEKLRKWVRESDTQDGVSGI